MPTKGKADEGSRKRKTRSFSSSRRRFLGAAGVTGVTGLAGCTGMLGDESITLRVLNTAYEDGQKAWQEIFDEFENQHDNVSIEYNRVDFADAPSRASQAHAGDDPYDLASLASPGNNVYGVREGLFQPINDVIEDMGGTDHWFEGVLFKIDGDHYLAPDAGTVLNQIYRIDMFEDAGVDVPPFDSFENYLSAAEQLTNTEENQYGHPVFLGTNHFHGTWPMCMVLGNGGHLVNENGEIVWDSQETVEVLEMYKQLNQYSPESAHNASIPDMRPPLYQGNYAMTWYSTNLVPYDIEEYNPDLKGLVDVAPPPAADGNDPVARMTGTGYGLSSKTENPDMAKELLKHMTSLESMTKLQLAAPAQTVPVAHGLLDQDALWETDILQEYEDHYRNLVSIAQNYGRIIAVAENPDSINPVTGQALSEAHVIKTFQDVILNDMAPQDAATKWADQMREDFL